MNPFILLAGVAVAAFLFAAFLWSFAQIFRVTGWLRMAHGAVAGLLVLTIAAIDFGLQLPVQFLAACLFIAALVALWFETGWARLLPGILLVFGAVMTTGFIGPKASLPELTAVSAD